MNSWWKQTEWTSTTYCWFGVLVKRWFTLFTKLQNTTGGLCKLLSWLYTNVAQGQTLEIFTRCTNIHFKKLIPPGCLLSYSAIIKIWTYRIFRHVASCPEILELRNVISRYGCAFSQSYNKKIWPCWINMCELIVPVF